MSGRKLNLFFQVLLEFLMFYKERGTFYFCVRVNFFLHFCYLGNDLDIRKSSKNNLLDFMTQKSFSKE